MRYAAILGSRIVDVYASIEDAQADMEVHKNGWVLPIPEKYIDIEEFLYEYNATSTSPLYYIPW